MGLTLAGLCLEVGCCSFACAYVACGTGRVSHAYQHARPDVVADLVRAVRAVPWVSRLLGRAEVSRARATCLKQMPVMLDVVTLGLSAGLSFDSSLELYCQRYHNDLSHALGGALLAWKLGTSTREQALEEVARRLGVSSLERFASVVAQALAFGSPLAATLERQSQAIRDEQRSQMEEEIERVPVRMLIPLGTLIVPAMLMAILGPLLGASLAMG